MRKQVVHEAAQADTEVLVLGTWGCGAYGGDPKVVAEAFREALRLYAGCIAHVVFAIYGGPRENYTVFDEVF